MSNTVTASRFNLLQRRITDIMSSSTNITPEFGYNQTVSSTDVTGSRNQPSLENVNKVSSIDYQNLYLDLARARIHQIGSSSFAQTAFPIGDFLTNSNADKIELSYIEFLENLMTAIENDKFLLDVGTQGEIINLKNVNDQDIQSTRTLSWGGVGQNQVVTHIFTVSFSSVSERRHFFNTGGQIRFEASLAYSGSEPKTLNWVNLLASIGTVIFSADKTVSSNSQGVNTNIGNYQLTGSNTQVYRIFGTSVYSPNSYRILARNLSETQIQFQVEFRDDDVGSGPVQFRIDEPVRGILTSGPIRFARANGSAIINGIPTDTVVNTETPIGNTTINL